MLFQYRISRNACFHFGILENPAIISMFYFLPTIVHLCCRNYNQSFIIYWLWFFAELVILDEQNIAEEES